MSFQRGCLNGLLLMLAFWGLIGWLVWRFFL